MTETEETVSQESQPSEAITEPQNAEPITETSDTPGVSDAHKEDRHEEQNPASTVKELLAPFAEILKDGNKKAAPKIREVLTALHQDGRLTLLGNEQYYAVRKELASRLSVTPQLVEKCAKEVLKVQNEDASDDPQFPEAPAGYYCPQPTTPTPAPVSASGGGAPFGG